MIVARFLLHHRHGAGECGVAFAAFKGHDSPLRRSPAFSSCRSGHHAVWWVVEAPDEAAALALLPHFVANRSTATRVQEVQIP